jgi:hypothetical protein
MPSSAGPPAGCPAVKRWKKQGRHVTDLPGSARSWGGASSAAAPHSCQGCFHGVVLLLRNRWAPREAAMACSCLSAARQLPLAVAAPSLFELHLHVTRDAHRVNHVCWGVDETAAQGGPSVPQSGTEDQQHSSAPPPGGATSQRICRALQGAEGPTGHAVAGQRHGGAPPSLRAPPTGA